MKVHLYTRDTPVTVQPGQSVVFNTKAISREHTARFYDDTGTLHEVRVADLSAIDPGVLPASTAVKRARGREGTDLT